MCILRWISVIARPVTFATESLLSDLLSKGKRERFVIFAILRWRQKWRRTAVSIPFLNRESVCLAIVRMLQTINLFRKKLAMNNALYVMIRNLLPGPNYINPLKKAVLPVIRRMVQNTLITS
jgi:hypothetical protein